MALQFVNNLLLASVPSISSSSAATTVNAVGESVGVIGQMRWVGNATGKVVSSSGGKILWVPQSVTWANAGTNLRVGIQDVDMSTGLEDGTFDVYADLVPGTETLTTSTFDLRPMESGTKTISSGDLVAIVVEMTARGGVDSVNVNQTVSSVFQFTLANGFPYGTQDTGSLAKSAANMLWAVVVADDGTVGWIEGGAPVLTGGTLVSVNSGSTPDEYCGTFTPTWKMQVSGIGVLLSAIASTDAFEVILYTDPLGTPVATATATPDQDVVAGSSNPPNYHLFSITPTTLTPGVTYGVAFRPTTANSINYYYGELGDASVAAVVKAAVPLPSLVLAGRTNQTGSFTEVSNTRIPLITLAVTGLDDGVNSGSAGGSYAFA